MITLKTDRKLQALMSGAANTTNPDYVVSYRDNQGAEGGKNGTLSGATAVDLTEVTPDGHTRIVESLTIYNADDANVTVTVRVNDNSDSGGAVNRIVTKITLLAGETLIYDDSGWHVVDTSGAQKTTAVSTGTVDINGTADGLILDADGNTTISAPTDDQIDFEIGGADDFTMTANAFNVLTGSAVTFADSCQVKFGTGNDITMAWDGTDFDILQAGTDSSIKVGVDGAGMDLVLYGDTASTNMTWDQSADSLIFNGAARIVWTGTTGQAEMHLTDNLADALSIEISGSTDLMVFTTTNNAESVAIHGLRTKGTTAVAITGATALTLADSGGIFTVDQGSAYDIDLPSPTSGPGCTYFFSLTAPAANAVTITVLGGAATFVGSVITEGQIVVATGSTLTFASGTAVLGDSIEVRSIATNLYHVRAVSAILNGITIA